MFTGIVEFTGKILSAENHHSNKTFWIESDISSQLHIDESLSHNGVCLTVEEIRNNSHRVTTIKETIEKTTIKKWSASGMVNLERSMLMNGRLDGHIVQGHVDCTAKCIEKKELNGSWEFTFKIKEKFAPLIIEKGSICIDGVSLTAFNVRRQKFTVAIIPYTFANTNFSQMQKGMEVNVEFDVLGKYVQRIININAIK
jgi:riboflavin synthase